MTICYICEVDMVAKYTPKRIYYSFLRKYSPIYIRFRYSLGGNYFKSLVNVQYDLKGNHHPLHPSKIQLIFKSYAL